MIGLAAGGPPRPGAPGGPSGSVPATTAVVDDAPRTDAAPTRLLRAWYRTGRADLAAHESVHGTLPLPGRHDHGWPGRLVELVHSSGLAGRGGAGFPSARKLDAARVARPGPILAVNAMEGEPASAKDQVLLAHAPHLVLDGAQLVAAAVGASGIVLCMAHERLPGSLGVQAALDERRAAHVDARAVEIVGPPGRYISGEESALVSWLGGGFARPTFRASKATPLTIRRRPVLVHNAETLAHVALIARHGVPWFRAVGPPDSPGTCLVTVSGTVRLPGVQEIALGTPIASVIGDADPVAEVQAVLVGGYGGTWVPAGLLPTPFAPASLRAIGADTGAGVLVALPRAACGLVETARLATYLAAEGAGQCGPCLHGLPAIAADLTSLAHGYGDGDVLARLQHRMGAVDGRGACRHPDGAVRLVRSALRVFADDVTRHAAGHPCPGRAHSPVLAPAGHAGREEHRWRYGP